MNFYGNQYSKIQSKIKTEHLTKVKIIEEPTRKFYSVAQITARKQREDKRKTLDKKCEVLVE